MESNKWSQPVAILFVLFVYTSLFITFSASTSLICISLFILYFVIWGCRYAIVIHACTLQKTFWKRCELLIWQFRQERLYEEALDLMAWILSLVPGLRSHVVTRWVKVKKDIVNPALLKR